MLPSDTRGTTQRIVPDLERSGFCAQQGVETARYAFLGKECICPVALSR